MSADGLIYQLAKSIVIQAIIRERIRLGIPLVPATIVIMRRLRLFLWLEAMRAGRSFGLGKILLVGCATANDSFLLMYRLFPYALLTSSLTDGSSHSSPVQPWLARRSKHVARDASLRDVRIVRLSSDPSMVALLLLIDYTFVDGPICLGLNIGLDLLVLLFNCSESFL